MTTDRARGSTHPHGPTSAAIEQPVFTDLSRRGRIALVTIVSITGGVDLVLHVTGTPNTWQNALSSAVMLFATALFGWKPLTAAILLLMGALTHMATGPPGDELLHLAIGSGLVAYTSPSRFTAIYVSAVIGLSAFAVATSSFSDIGGVVALGLVLITCSGIGIALSAAHRRQQHFAADLARLERAREAAVTTERFRITDELHDTIARNITLIAMHVRVLERVRDQEGRDASQEVIRNSADQALADIRRLLRVANDSQAGGEHMPETVAVGHALKEAERELTALGATVEIVQRGPLNASSSVEHATVRIVREAVTNIIKHGPTSPHVSIDLRADDHGIRLGISNSLSGTTSPEDFPRTSGYGLARLRERASLLGGTLETQQSGESFTLMARLPEK